MKLKGRLFTAFLIIMMLPIILLGTIGSTIIKYNIHTIQEQYDIKVTPLELISSPIQVLNKITRGIYNEVILIVQKEPDKLLNQNYIKYLNQQLKQKCSYMVISKGDKIVYCGDHEKFKHIQNHIQNYEIFSLNKEGSFYNDGQYPFLLKQLDFYYDDGTPGSVLIITDTENTVPQIKTFLYLIILASVIAIAITATVLIIWIYQSILRPINTLHTATYAMKEGNLDYSIEGDPDDEIGQLCIDFEEMRVRLKELIEVRLKYEQDTKELISNISHDLKTPITAIKGYAEGIMDGVAVTDEKKEKYIKTIYNKANDMSVLVDELAFYSKIDSNNIPYEFKVINLHDYFEDCIDEIRMELEFKNIEVSFINTTDKNTYIQADAEQLKRVINNIINNSVKYMNKENGRIRIWIIDIGEFVQIAFEDNGKGISEKDLPYIFERFYRADTSRNSAKGGSGIGLAIAKKVIEDHMGKIWAESEEGKETIICFSLKKYKEEVNNE